MKLLMLDGMCEGQIYYSKDAPPIFKIHFPKELRLDDCLSSPSFEATPQYERKYVYEYKRAFFSLDGEMVLYSVDGSHYAMTNGRDWVLPKKIAFKKRHKIHFIKPIRR